MKKQRHQQDVRIAALIFGKETKINLLFLTLKIKASNLLILKTQDHNILGLQLSAIKIELRLSVRSKEAETPIYILITILSQILIIN